MKVEEQLSAGREAERLLSAIGKDAMNIEQQLQRPSKRLKVAQGGTAGLDTHQRVQSLLQFLVDTKKRLEHERDVLMQNQAPPLVSSLLHNKPPCH